MNQQDDESANLVELPRWDLSELYAGPERAALNK